MTEAEFEAFGGLIDALAAQFRVEQTPALIEGFWMGLEDLQLGDVRRAIGRAIRECQHMPRVVELRRLCGDMTPSDRAVLAWGALTKAIQQHGSYVSVNFDDPLINAAVRNLGGWQLLCAKETEEFEKWTRKDFERVYASLMQSGTSEESCKYLAGRHEISNQAMGYEIAPPAFVATGLPPHRAPIVRHLVARDGEVIGSPLEHTARLLAASKELPK